MNQDTYEKALALINGLIVASENIKTDSIVTSRMRFELEINLRGAYHNLNDLAMLFHLKVDGHE